ncbi:hypothetical protein H0X90_26445 [Burkholderia sp. 9775_39]|uniref:hypothetical protein n=1 Tax=unclassified Burkholderia TaxID=2613784 RepID=UPI0018C3F26C|nr:MULTISPECIES: hypothetical protein [unclassified Burkholderia]MBG0880342.1 hypothetical protein [Burkholderia sp. 9775_39]MBG0886167.1 hypothetical protein [Burkholderia sp. 9773_38]
MDIREIQALHAQYSSQPVVIDINSHIRALPAPDRHESPRPLVSAHLASTGRRFGRPAAIVVALALGAAVAGVCTSKLWRSLHAPQAAAHIDPATSQLTGTTPEHVGAASIPNGSKPPLTSADFDEPAGRAAATQPRVDADALRASEALGSPTLTKQSTSAAPLDPAKAAASPIRVAHAAAGPAAGQLPAPTAPAQAVPAAASAPAVSAPTVSPAAQPRAVAHRAHRTPARQRQDAAIAEASAPDTRIDAARPEHTPKSGAPAKAGDVPLF